jgi:hypothetical protein
MTPEGIKRTEDVVPNEAPIRGTGRKLDLLIIGVLLAVITIMIFKGVHPYVSPSAFSIPEKSIAVLQETLHVIRRRLDPEIDVFGKSSGAVEHRRLSADQQVGDTV